MKIKRQMSDTLTIGIVLAVIGGFLDAYTYLCKGQVFANAQTGNIVLLGIQVIEGNFVKVLYYLLPIMAFFIGILIAEVIRNHYKNHHKIHWRQIVIMIELLVLLGVSFIPQGEMNMVCNILISFVCSLQVESFRKFHGNPYASTMCTGNLRTATEHLYLYFHSRDKKTLTKSLQYYFIILFFIIGACLGAIFTNLFSSYALLICVALLLIVAIVMFIKQEG